MLWQLCTQTRIGAIMRIRHPFEWVLGTSAVGANAGFVAAAVVSASGTEPLECACGAAAVGAAAGAMAALKWLDATG